MPSSFGIVANVYQEANAIHGWLEMACGGLFDDVCVFHTGPGGAYSTDGTIEACERWGARIVYGSIDEGFGAVRTQAVRNSSCEWVLITDADERFHRLAPVIRCNADLTTVMDGEPYNQGAWVRAMLSRTDIDAICTIRRHWHDMTWTRPTQDWNEHRDWQLRIVRNIPEVHYTTYPKMHERITDDRTGQQPRFRVADFPHGPFHDHYHLWFKAQEPAQRQHDIAVYDALHFGRPVPTWEQFWVSDEAADMRRLCGQAKAEREEVPA